jgi:outer membrane protein TolC
MRSVRYWIILFLFISPFSLQAETATVEKLSLKEAVDRALARNLSAILARRELERAAAITQEARAGSLPSLTLNASLIRLDDDRVSAGRVAAAKDQQTGNLNLSIPLVAPQRWVQWSQATMQEKTAEANAAEVRRTVALTTARAYLTIIAQKRLLETAERALATDRAHFDYTRVRFQGGVGTKVDQIRAAQLVAVDAVACANARLALGRAREALGLLVGNERPVDTADDPKLETANPERALDRRADVLAAKQRSQALEKIRRDSWADYTPLLSAQIQPFFQHPSTLTTPETGWQAMLLFSFPLFEGGLRAGQLAERKALAAQAQASYEALVRQTNSDVRVGTLAGVHAAEALVAANQAAQLAHEALTLANLAYESGATTNIEVIDAERRARDADSAVAVAEDTLRQARLDLLAASGQFP